MRIIEKLPRFVAALFILCFFSVSGIGKIDWTGEYFYDEVGGETAGGTKIYIAHNLKIYEIDGKLEASIYSQGFQTSRDLFADAVIENTRLDLYFREYGPDQVFKGYRKGELVFSLEWSEDGILTNWGVFKPVLTSNDADGKTRFVKSNLKERETDEPTFGRLTRFAASDI